MILPSRISSSSRSSSVRRTPHSVLSSPQIAQVEQTRVRASGDKVYFAHRLISLLDVLHREHRIRKGAKPRIGKLRVGSVSLCAPDERRQIQHAVRSKQPSRIHDAPLVEARVVVTNHLVAHGTRPMLLVDSLHMSEEHQRYGFQQCIDAYRLFNERFVLP